MKLQKESLKTYLKKLNMKIKIFHHTKQTGKILSKTMNQLLLMSSFHFNLERENKVLLLMINDDDDDDDDDEKYCYFAV